MQYAQPAGLWRGKGARPACKDLLTINIAAELLPVASMNHELKLKAGLRKTFWLCPPRACYDNMKIIHLLYKVSCEV